MSLLQFIQDMRNPDLSLLDKYSSFRQLTAYIDGLTNKALGKITYTDKQLSEHIFENTWKTSQVALVQKKHLFAAHNTLQRLDRKITALNIDQYQFMLNALAYDLYDTVAYIEQVTLKGDLKYIMGSRPDQSAREIFDVGRVLFDIGTINPADLYLREIIPVSVFLLRQTIEVYGKRLLGIHSITDDKGHRAVNVSTQVAWDFIKAETLRPCCRITLPTNVDMIRKVEKWTNYYVHTGDIPPIYLIENAVHMVESLIYPLNTTVMNHHSSIVYLGTTKIKNYMAVRSDFELFVNQKKSLSQIESLWRRALTALRFKNTPGRIIVNWRNETSIDATITSL